MEESRKVYSLVMNPQLFTNMTLNALQERWAAASIEKRNDQSPVNVARNVEANRHGSIPISAVPPADSTSQSDMDLQESRLRMDEAETPGATQRPAAAAAAEAVAKGEARIFHYPTGQLRTVAAFDITAGDVPREIAKKGSGTFVLLIFVLSAMHPQHHGVIARRCAEVDSEARWMQGQTFHMQFCRMIETTSQRIMA
ncbi:hypothetical protein Emag_003944 [Eimeria magna]